MSPGSPALQRPPTAEAIRLPTRRSLSEDVYQALVTMLMDRVISPGSPITIDDLARRLSVSPTPIRESLSRLEAEGLVYRQQNRGFFSSAELTRAEVDELFQLRQLLEPWNAAEAARRRTEDSAAALTELFEAFDFREVGSDYPRYRAMLEHDASLHDHIAAMAGNGQIRAALTRTHAHLHLFRLQNRASGLAETQAEHHQIVKAVVDGDAAAARSAMTRHLRLARRRFPTVRGDDDVHDR
jgi:DNA-binding GntR family transcriptional regulator